MTTLSQALRTPCRNALLAGLTLLVLLLPPCALSAEREGTVLFFSVEDLRQALAHPSLPRSRNCHPAWRGGSSPRRWSRTAPWSRMPAGATVWGSMGILALGPAPCGATKV